MRKLLFFSFILSSSLCNSQDSKIPELKWKRTYATYNKYVELLDLKDKEALILNWIIKADLPRYPAKNSIVFLNDGTIKRFRIVHYLDSVSVYPIVVDSTDFESYWNFLALCDTEEKLHFDQSLLNAKPKCTVTKEATHESPTTLKTCESAPSHGLSYNLSLYQGKKEQLYRTFAPEYLIPNKFPGYEEKQKLVNLFQALQNLINEN